MTKLFFTDCLRDTDGYLATFPYQREQVVVFVLSHKSYAAFLFSSLGPLLQKFQMDRDRRESGRYKARCSASDVDEIHGSTVSLPGPRGVSSRVQSTNEVNRGQLGKKGRTNHLNHDFPQSCRSSNDNAVDVRDVDALGRDS